MLKHRAVITSAKAEGAEQVILTDHNEFQQSVSDIAEVEVYGVVDHHRVANFETASPLYMRFGNQLDQHHLSFTACSKSMA